MKIKIRNRSIIKENLDQDQMMDKLLKLGPVHGAATADSLGMKEKFEQRAAEMIQARKDMIYRLYEIEGLIDNIEKNLDMAWAPIKGSPRHTGYLVQIKELENEHESLYPQLVNIENLLEPWLENRFTDAPQTIEMAEAIKMDLMKQINKDLEKIKRPGVSPEMGMSLAASDPNLERMFAAELEDRKEVILHALDKLVTASVEWKGKWNPNHPRAQEMNLMVAELSKSLAGIQRALASRKQVDEAIEIDLAKSIKKDFNKIADYTSVPPEMAMALASSNPALEKMYIEYLRQQKALFDSAIPGLIANLERLKKSFGSPKHPDHHLVQQMSDTLAKFTAAQAGMEKVLASRKQVSEVIEKTDGKEQWCLYSKKKGKDGKRKKLGCYRSRSGAEKRERQVQYFKSLEEQ